MRGIRQVAGAKIGKGYKLLSQPIDVIWNGDVSVKSVPRLRVVGLRYRITKQDYRNKRQAEKEESPKKPAPESQDWGNMGIYPVSKSSGEKKGNSSARS